MVARRDGGGQHGAAPVVLEQWVRRPWHHLFDLVTGNDVVGMRARHRSKTPNSENVLGPEPCAMEECRRDRQLPPSRHMPRPKLERPKVASPSVQASAYPRMTDPDQLQR